MLMGLNTMSDTVQILVESNGCTTAESFFVQKYIDRADEMIHLSFIRVMPDWCKAYHPNGVWLRFYKSELQVSTKDILRIDNPFGSSQRNKN